MVETQEEKSDVDEELERVGITDLRTVAKIKRNGKEYTFIPNIEITIDLEKKRGIHMSRLIESISETVEEATMGLQSSISGLEKDILERLNEKHEYKRAEIKMETELVISDKTPVSDKDTYETHDVEIKLTKEGENFRKNIKVEVIGSTACPHSKVNNNGKTHIQRAIGVLEINSNYGNNVNLEDMISIVENSFSSETYTLLKTEDENYVVQKMYENPKFVEDVAREILHRSKKKFDNCKIHAKCVSKESIHKHDAMAEGWASK